VEARRWHWQSFAAARCVRVPGVVVLACLLFTFSTVAADASARVGHVRPATMVIRVSGLPPGVAASVAVRGPHFSTVLAGPRTFRGLRPGAYSLTIREVRIARAQRRVRAGSLALPRVSRVHVRLRAGHASTVVVQYGTIVNANVRRLPIQPLGVVGEPTNPSAIVVRAPTTARVGTILTAAPSTRLPAGLFHVVVSVHRSGRAITLGLRPAHLIEAFPQLSVNSTVDFAPGKAIAAQVRTAAFEPLIASLGIGNFRCQLPLADSSFTAQQNISVNAVVQFNIPTFFGIPVGLPEGKLALTLKASASLDAFLRKNTGCSAEVSLPPLPGAIPVGPVVVPVYAQVGIFGSATLGADLHASASAGFNLMAGVEFHGTSIHNISGASAHASASATGAGRLMVGPQLRLAVGVAAVADVHFDARPALAFTAALDGSCSLELVAGSRVGISIGPFQLNQNLPAPSLSLYTCPKTPPASQASLSITQAGSPGAFPNQAVSYTTTVTNTSSTTAHGVEVADTLPAEGSFISSSPGASPATPVAGGSDTSQLGDIGPGETRVATLRWTAPSTPTSLTNSVLAKAANAPLAGPAIFSIPVGTTGNCNPCGAASGGTGLRNRDHGTITISGIPPGATVARAVLIWGILYGGEVPSDRLTFDGHPVSANVTSHSSGTLCWGDAATVGYAADVTPYVEGNGTYEVTNPPNGEIHVDENPYGTLPYTDGASLIVFYNGGGADNQVLSDFSYNTNTDPETEDSITRSFDAVHSVGGTAALTLAGPDGQNNYGKVFTFTGAGEETVVNPFEGLAPQDGPSFPIGNLWDDESFDVSHLLPPGQETLTFHTTFSEDCIGVGAAVLQVAQAPSL
jgi:uncharacterized repeat protein (TIGR01451 family)